MVTSTNISVDLADPVEFFREQVCAALRQEDLQIDEQIEFYLVRLLVDFINPDKSFSPALLGGEVLDTPLAMVLARAMEKEGEEQLKVYKTLGDTSLYLAGFFNDYFNRRPYGMDYYIMLGKQAYAAVFELSRAQSGYKAHEPKLYHSLASEFDSYVDVIASVSERLAPNQNVNLLGLYERWLTSGGERLRKKLEDEGIIPLPSPQEPSN